MAKALKIQNNIHGKSGNHLKLLLFYFLAAAHTNSVENILSGNYI
jgi:hypothetical protein